MKKFPQQHKKGFALVMTLCILALVVVTVLGYLFATRGDRVSTGFYANHARAQIMADSGFTAALDLLKENTRHGNYITAQSPDHPFTELYRPAEASDYIREKNAVGVVLASRRHETLQGQIDPAATPQELKEFPKNLISAAQPSAQDGFDFNQIIRFAGKPMRLLNPDGERQAAEWMHVKDATGRMIGRYAFFMEDESMKLNVNTAGNADGANGEHQRVSDLAAAPSNSTSQLQQINPAALLANPPPNAIGDLVNLGQPGERLPTRSTLPLLASWKEGFDSYAHMATSLSKDDNTTARGWKRMNLNQVVAEAEKIGTNKAKTDAAKKISDWIRNAWTGPVPLEQLFKPTDTSEEMSAYQIFNDERLRMQLAANIVDYIDKDRIPTFCGYMDAGGESVPVIGIEKVPMLSETQVVFKSNLEIAPDGIDISNPIEGLENLLPTSILMKLRFEFLNPFDEDLQLSDVVKKIRVTGIPPIAQEGFGGALGPLLDPLAGLLFDQENTSFEVPITGAMDGVVPWNQNGDARLSARTFDSGNLIQAPITALIPGVFKSRALEGVIKIEVLGQDDIPIDVTNIVVNNDRILKYRDRDGGGNLISDLLPHLTDFLFNGRSAAIVGYPMQVDNGGGTGGPSMLEAGDPGYRPSILSRRWFHIEDTTEARFNHQENRLPKTQPHSFGMDWFSGNDKRPILFHRDGPMLDIGELGNIPTGEYPWRTLYIQQRERPGSSENEGVNAMVERRRREALDYVLSDLFTVEEEGTRRGGYNINSRLSGAQGKSQSPVRGLLDGVPVASQSIDGDSADVIRRGLFARLSPNGTVENDVKHLLNSSEPRGPYQQIGEVAGLLGRAVCSTDGSSVTHSIFNSDSTYATDPRVEQAFRQISGAVTTRGNVFRVLYVGQAVKDINRNGKIESPKEVFGEYLGEAFVERIPIFEKDPDNPAIEKTVDSKYRVVSKRVITQ